MQANTKLLVFFLLLALAAVMVYLSFALGAIVAIFLLSVLIAFILAPFVNALESVGINRTLAALIVFALFIGVITATIQILSPFVFDELSHLQEVVSVGQMRKAVRDLESYLSRNLAFLGVRRLHVAPKVEEWVGALLDNLLNIASGLVGLILFLVMTMISAFFFLKDARRLKKTFIALVPNRFFETALGTVHKIEWSLGAYLRGILLDAMSIGVITTFALWAINLPYFFVVGTVAGIANLVPYLGPPTAAIVASFVSVITTDSFSQVPLILLVFSAIRLLDDSVIQPLTISQSVRMHPLIIIFAILVGGHLYGIIGMLFAVPIFGVAKVVLSEIYNAMVRYRPVSQ